MPSRSNFQTFALLLCVLALLASQTFGVQRGYLCVCSGRAVLTQASHCHGPHGSQCHDASSVNSSASHNEAGQGSREEHAAIKGDLPVRSAEVIPQVIVPVALLATLPLFEILSAAPEVPVVSTLVAGEEDLPPLGVAVARTVVLVI